MPPGSDRRRLAAHDHGAQERALRVSNRGVDSLTSLLPHAQLAVLRAQEETKRIRARQWHQPTAGFDEVIVESAPPTWSISERQRVEAGPAAKSPVLSNETVGASAPSFARTIAAATQSPNVEAPHQMRKPRSRSTSQSPHRRGMWLWLARMGNQAGRAKADKLLPQPRESSERSRFVAPGQPGGGARTEASYASASRRAPAFERKPTRSSSRDPVKLAARSPRPQLDTPGLVRQLSARLGIQVRGATRYLKNLGGGRPSLRPLASRRLFEPRDVFLMVLCALVSFICGFLWMS
jgi:hypothetical protein